MKPSIVLKIFVKAIIIPLFAMFVLSQWNICSYLLFIPKNYTFEAGLSLYMATFEAIVEIIEHFIEQNRSIIRCIFYENENREDNNTKPIIYISEAGMDVASVWCHIVLQGRWKQLKGMEIVLDIPNWFSVQPDKTGIITQANGKLTWNIDALLPTHDNGKKLQLESRMKLSFIRNSPNTIEINIEPTVNKKRGTNFLTNGLTIQNMG